MATQKSWAPILNILLGLALVCLSWPAAYAGAVPILGVIVAAFAPTMFLVGVFFIALGLARMLADTKVGVVLLIAIVIVVVGLNSRLLSLQYDIRNVDANKMQVVTQYEEAVGQPIHIVSEASELSARRLPYAHAAPACYGDVCFVTRGFRTPSPEGSYWRENVTDVVVAAGFSKARAGEAAPVLTISQKAVGHFLTIDIQLTSADGKVLSRYVGRYRNGHRYETADGVESDSPTLVLEYLLHGNPLNDAVARLAHNGEAYPLSSFLRRATSLSHPQGLLRTRSSVEPSVGSASQSTNVELETLEERIHEPVLVIKGDRESSSAEWSKLSWDRIRTERCKTLLKPETKDALTQTWHLFIGDPSGRKKAKHTGHAFCDEDAIWFLDYAIEKGRLILTKYSPTGDLSYQVSFAKPNEPAGFQGHIMIPTFRADNGYVRFEWWNTKQSGWDRHVARSLRVQFAEPLPTVDPSSEKSSNEQSPASVRSSVPSR